MLAYLREVVCIPAAPLSIQLLMNVPGRIVDDVLDACTQSENPEDIPGPCLRTGPDPGMCPFGQ